MEHEPIQWQNLIEQRISRRRLLQAGALGAVAAAGLGLEPTPLLVREAEAASRRLPFKPIKPTKQDTVVLPTGFRYDVVVKWGDAINSTDTFGFNNDYTAYFPISQPAGTLAARKRPQALLTVNNEYADPNKVGGQPATPKSAAQVQAEAYSVGISVIRIRQNTNGAWQLVKDDVYARRITAFTFPVLLTGPASGSASVGGNRAVAGTLGNCSGGHTPWDTMLSCEENYQDTYGEHSLVNDGAGGIKEETDPAKRRGTSRWHDVVPFDGVTGYAPAGGIVVRPEHYGYVIEVDPYNPQEAPRKHTAMGRFRHENVAIRSVKNKKVVCYMGDDRRAGHVYKFVTEGVYRAGDQYREANKRLLERGKLYVAQFSSTGPADNADAQGTGSWIPISNAIGQNDPVTGQPFTAASALVHTFQAAQAVGGTPTDRPEDIEIHPKNGSVFIAFTNNSDRNITHGYIVQLKEVGNNPEATEFTWDVLAFGGADADNNQVPANGTGFSSPDNLVFDHEANLWMVTDISSGSIAAGGSAPAYVPFGNNGMFYCPISGKDRGKCFQFASMPVEAEGTGPTWSPDRRTLFLSVQHPGEDASEKGLPASSHWPEGGNAVAKPAVIAIRGFHW